MQAREFIGNSVDDSRARWHTDDKDLDIALTPEHKSTVAECALSVRYTVYSSNLVRIQR